MLFQIILLYIVQAFAILVPARPSAVQAEPNKNGEQSYYCTAPGTPKYDKKGHDPDVLDLPRGFRVKYYNYQFNDMDTLLDTEWWINGYKHIDNNRNKPEAKPNYVQRGVIDTDYDLSSEVSTDPTLSFIPYGHEFTNTNFTMEYTAYFYSWDGGIFNFKLDSNLETKLAIGQFAFRCDESNTQGFPEKYDMEKGMYVDITGGSFLLLPNVYYPIRIVHVAANGMARFRLKVFKPEFEDHPIKFEQYIVDPDALEGWKTPSVTQTSCFRDILYDMTVTGNDHVTINRQIKGTTTRYAITDTPITEIGNDCVATIISPPTYTYTKTSGSLEAMTTIDGDGNELVLVPTISKNNPDTTITPYISITQTVSKYSAGLTQRFTTVGTDMVETIFLTPVSTIYIRNNYLIPTTYVQPNGMEIIILGSNGGNVGNHLK